MADRQITYQGLTIGEGTAYSIDSIDGLSTPSVRSSDRLVSLRDGLHPGDDYYEGRTVTLSTFIPERTTAAMNTKRTALMSAFAGGHAETPLVFQVPGVAGGGERRINVRPRRAKFAANVGYGAGLSRDIFQLFATDPRIYDNTETVKILTLPASYGTGLTWPLTWPLNWGPAGSDSTFVNNQGNFNAPATFRIDGPVENPRIENLTLNRTLAIDITLSASQYLQIDADARTVLLNGTANRYSLLTQQSAWWLLQPGSNEIRFRAAAPTAATMTLTWRSAWIG
jgi:hypothetical protein